MGTSNTLHSALDTQHTTSKKPSIHRHHKHLQHPYIHITMSQLSYARYGKDNIRLYKVKRNGDGFTIKSGIDKLLVLKSTGSAFYGFHRDEYTALPETWDRILSTEVKADWTWRTFDSLATIKSKAGEFDPAFKAAHKITTETFAKDESASVQNTMYKMSDQILAAVPLVEKVDYLLPNKHYFEIDLSWHKGLKNTGKDAEVYAPQSDPNGLIQSTVTRKGGKARL